MIRTFLLVCDRYPYGTNAGDERAPLHTGARLRLNEIFDMSIHVAIPFSFGSNPITSAAAIPAPKFGASRRASSDNSAACSRATSARATFAWDAAMNNFWCNGTVVRVAKGFRLIGFLNLSRWLYCSLVCWLSKVCVCCFVCCFCFI